MFVDFNILNQLGSPSINSNTFANRPSAGQVGRLFVSTDTFEIYRDNGTGWDLIGGPGSSTVTGSGAAGQVTYWTGTNSVGGENNLWWDAANNHLGINTSTPGVALDVHSAADVGVQLNGTGATPSILQAFLSAGVSQYQIGYNWNSDINYRRFSIYDSQGSKEVISIDQQSRYVGINYQYSSLTDQPAYTFDVSGSVRFTDSAIFNTVSGSSLFGTTTDFTTITQGGTIKINGFGIYPFTQNDLVTNTTEFTGAILQNSTAFSGTNGASGQSYSSIYSAPLLSNNSSGGTNANTVTGIFITPTFSATSGTAPNNINGIVSNCYRITSTDTSTGSGNVVGMRVNVRTAPPVPSTIVNSNLGAILATAIHNSGTSSQVYSLRSQLTAGSSGANTSTVSNYMGHIRCDAYNVGAASGNSATVPTGFGIFLSGPNVLATGTLTTYYALYQGAANVTGTLTNRWGIYIDDTNAKNYFGGNTLIGTTTDVGGTNKLQVAGNVYLNAAGGGDGLRYILNNTSASEFQYAIVNGGSSADSFQRLSLRNGSYGTNLLQLNDVGTAFLQEIKAGKSSILNTTAAENGTGGGNRQFDLSFTPSGTNGFNGTDNGDQGYGYFPVTITSGKTYEIKVTMATTNGAPLVIISSTTKNFATSTVDTIESAPINGTTYHQFTATGNAAYIGFGFSRSGGTLDATVSNFSIVEINGVLVTNTETVTVNGKIETTGTIKTGAPTTGTAAEWKLGQRVAAAVVLDATQYIQVEVGGTFYKLAIVT